MGEGGQLVGREVGRGYPGQGRGSKGYPGVGTLAAGIHAGASAGSQASADRGWGSRGRGHCGRAGVVAADREEGRAWSRGRDNSD